MHAHRAVVTHTNLLPASQASLDAAAQVALLKAAVLGKLASHLWLPTIIDTTLSFQLDHLELWDKAVV